PRVPRSTLFPYTTLFRSQSSPHRMLQGGTTTWFGSFYDGNLLQQENYISWASRSAHWQLNLTTENDFGHMSEGNFVQRLWQLKADRKSTRLNSSHLVISY